jgi:hypothetical protein
MELEGGGGVSNPFLEISSYKRKKKFQCRIAKICRDLNLHAHLTVFLLLG